MTGSFTAGRVWKLQFIALCSDTSIEEYELDDNWKDGWWIVKVSLLGTSPYV